ncbi:chemotaxis protein CheD [Heyndrickxia oleronia]|uniref:Probable chemoreceptor glutamine deamidase CheD n=1 Tax=Heyndrickxia oleronia TaxID=38875 RepID=A0A8E2LGE5_9BACI|nr:chemotaxis protein CheD [Heyndrickxia oleronia]MCM3454159.1 chemotaxis protein CheD [Heyndrickxia oleronia]MEC1376187.1 chemotaxis protein CheD [Heyndrickxia oleronia]OOP70373.1 chemotaxis protein CheD [Heyndrickxia oleronia]QQZ03199.1 chemotaxis protein CheD [Heyndrickxia oleronia]GIN37506.1 chemoreceptor glutamine deamidase CheD [Heyndrickxia oleronia]
METVIKVGIADLNIVRSPYTIRTTGLGSCVGVILYDESQRLAGLAHVMLPDSSIAKDPTTINKAKFADTAIKELLSKLVMEGSRAHKLKAKIAGGAEMFSFSSQNEMMRIGPRNVEAVKLALLKENIRIVAEDTGGNSGRTIEFDPSTCLLQIRTVNKGTKDI